MAYRGRNEQRTRLDQRSRFEDPRQKGHEEQKSKVETNRFRGDENIYRKNEEHDEDWTTSKNSDSSEVRELRSRMKQVMNKLSIAKRQKDQLAKENKNLQQQIMNLQSNLRQMIPCFSNTSSSFPMQAQLVVKLAEFCKCECLDLFFDILCPQLYTKGIQYFFTNCFSKLQALIQSYLSPAFTGLQTVGCFTTLQGPIMNVLRKSFQMNSNSIIQKIFTLDALNAVVNDLQSQLNLGQNSPQTNGTIKNFLRKLGQIIFECYISDPPIHIDITSIGKKVSFNPLKHDPFDGFIKPKQQCWIVIPQIKKNSQSGEMLAKAMVLQTSYDVIN